MNTVEFTVLAGVVIAALALWLVGILLFAMRKVIQNAKQEESHKTELQKAISKSANAAITTPASTVNSTVFMK